MEDKEDYVIYFVVKANQEDSWKEAKKQFERQFIEQALTNNKGNVFKTSLDIGLNRNTVFNHIKKYSIKFNKEK